jgi:hypothetical protein
MHLSWPCITALKLDAASDYVYGEAQNRPYDFKSRQEYMGYLE